MRQLHKTVLSSGTGERPTALVRVCLPVLVSMLFVPLVEGDEDIPFGFKVDRYQKVWERNPFTLVTPVAQQAQPTVFDKLVLLSWMKAGSKDVVLVQNSENNEVQQVTIEPNANNLRLVEIHANQNPQMVEAVLSDGKEQGSVKFKMESAAPAQPGSQPTVPVANTGSVNPQNPLQPVQLPNGMVPQNGVPQLPRPGQPGQSLRQQAQENTNLAIPNQSAPGSTPSRPGEIRRKRLAPPNAN
jgi:hypothetical protein